VRLLHLVGARMMVDAEHKRGCYFSNSLRLNAKLVLSVKQ
jgi:hypothetical protein